MKKIFTVLVAGLMMSAQVMAVTVNDVCGQFDGDLNIDGMPYPNKSVYLLPGTVENAVTFVLPDFTYGSKGKLGNIVLANIPMSTSGQLTLEGATLYLPAISERATINVLNGLEDQGTVYNSIISNSDAMVLLSISAPSLPESILVLFAGKAVRNNNYALVNGGFEGDWTGIEPQGWHSFGTASGEYAEYVLENTYQFVPSTDVRPGTTGAQSALISSNMLFGVKANGNCTNGQINAGSMTPDAPKANYNFSDPDSVGFNTPFQGRPDSIVFWAKYQPADKNPNNAVNKARMSTIITTNARYQDPEHPDSVYTNIKLASAEINYAATADLGWQRISVPFAYYPNNLDKEPAYILTTFTTNMTPGGGSSYKAGGSILNPINVVDTVYLDDVELVYNKRLTTLVWGSEVLSLDGSKFAINTTYCDSCATFSGMTNGVSSQYFVAYDGAHKCAYVYVIADDFAQNGAYSIYRVEFTDSEGGYIQGIENTAAREGRFEKVLINGQLFIRSNDAWYNASGVKVK